MFRHVSELPVPLAQRISAINHQSSRGNCCKLLSQEHSNISIPHYQVTLLPDRTFAYLCKHFRNAYVVQKMFRFQFIELKINRDFGKLQNTRLSIQYQPIHDGRGLVLLEVKHARG